MWARVVAVVEGGKRVASKQSSNSEIRTRTILCFGWVLHTHSLSLSVFVLLILPFRKLLIEVVGGLCFPSSTQACHVQKKG
jgi:hypothetical protein